MSLTLQETFGQIDRFVILSDGLTVHTAGEWFMMADASDSTEFVLSVDWAGRLVIHQLDLRGCAMLPPAFIEQKRGAARFPVDGFLKRPPVGPSSQMYV